jgi:hypothetical protein
MYFLKWLEILQNNAIFSLDSKTIEGILKSENNFKISLTNTFAHEFAHPVKFATRLVFSTVYRN